MVEYVVREPFSWNGTLLPRGSVLSGADATVLETPENMERLRRCVRRVVVGDPPSVPPAGPVPDAVDDSVDAAAAKITADAAALVAATKGKG